MGSQVPLLQSFFESTYQNNTIFYSKYTYKIIYLYYKHCLDIGGFIRISL